MSESRDETIDTTDEIKKLPRPIVRRRDTGEVLNMTPQQIGQIVATQNSTPEGQEEQKLIRQQRHTRYAEEARSQREGLERALQEVTTLDTTTVPGQFNALFASLYQLNPNFRVTLETNLGDLYSAVIAARPQWFPSSEITTTEEFWAILHGEGVSTRQYFTSLDQMHFIEAQPDSESKGYTLHEFVEWLRELNGKKPEEVRQKGQSEKSKSRSPTHLRQPTFYEARTGATAISDGRDLRNWKTIEGMTAMLHAPEDSIMQTRFEPCSMLLGWWGMPTGAQLETLQSELQKLEFDALVTYFVCLSWAIEKYQVTTSLDSIIEAIGRGTDARRKGQRTIWRAKIWRWMLLFDSLSVIGARPGTWREPRDGDKKREKIDPDKLYSRDALLKIIGTRATEQGTFDNSAPPKEVTFVAGAWVNQFRGNREILSDFGNVRAIASIPRGTTKGTWAACIGFALNQKWREQASYAPVTRIAKGDKTATTQKFRPFTRRVLLAQLWRSDVDPEEILKSVNPERAKEYWDAAIEILKKDDIIGIYKEIEPLPEEREGWQDAWLDQPLDIRPKGENRKDAIEIYQSAETARKRTRKKTAPKTA